MKATTPRSRGRRPKLKVVGGEKRPPRHRVVFGQWPDSRLVEFWSEAEWAALEEWERPEVSRAAWFPGVGYLILSAPGSQEEHDEVRGEYTDACQEGYALRELMES